MPQEASLEDLRAKSLEQIDHNRTHGVIDYETGEEKADAVFEIEEGLHYAGDQRLGPGNRFQPTKRQVENGSLKNKARELTRTEYQSLAGSPDTVSGADIGLRQFQMADGTLDYAIEHGLTEEDFEAEEGERSDGGYTRAQVERMVSERQEA